VPQAPQSRVVFAAADSGLDNDPNPATAQKRSLLSHCCPSPHFC
jgi:hypothetical protein